MQIYAGRVKTTRYDKTTPVHIAVSDEETHPISLCKGSPVSPIPQGPAIDITCGQCQDAATNLQTFLATREGVQVFAAR